MELIRPAQIPVLTNSGIESEQLLFPENSNSARVTITRVTMPPGSTNPRHCHTHSEQIWVALAGAGTLLLAEGNEQNFQAGEIARFSEGEVHGFINTGKVPFVYLSVTSPPENFRNAYAAPWDVETNRLGS